MLKDSVAIEDPKGNVERRLAMYSRNDVLELKGLEDLLAAPSPKPSESQKGLCECGCGLPTKPCEKTRSSRGFIKGQPQRYILGHAVSDDPHNPLQGNDRLLARRLRNQIVVDKLRAATTCIRCGAQPIEYHHPDHPKHPNRRVSCMVTQGKSLELILREIEICEPLCESCHQEIDGRAAGLRRYIGELHGNAQLTEKIVRDIFFSADKPDVIARQYGIHVGTVHKIRRGARWKHLNLASERSL